MTLAAETHAHDHSHEHGHSHGHDRAHHDHAHGHEALAQAPRRANPGLSLLRMSSLQRLSIAATAIACIWLGVFWAWA